MQQKDYSYENYQIEGMEMDRKENKKSREQPSVMPVFNQTWHLVIT